MALTERLAGLGMAGGVGLSWLSLAGVERAALKASATPIMDACTRAPMITRLTVEPSTQGLLARYMAAGRARKPSPLHRLTLSLTGVLTSIKASQASEINARAGMRALHMPPSPS